MTNAENSGHFGVIAKLISVPMPDGVRLAVDAYLPKGFQPGTQLPRLASESASR